MRKIKNPWRHKEGYDCFGCSPENPIGLHMEFYEDGDKIISFWHPQEHYQGWVDTLHGGIISTLIDETAAWVIARKLQTTGVTSRLEVKFRKSVMTTESLITVKAFITERKRNFITIHVALENSLSEVCAEADAVYFTFSEQQAKDMGFGSCELEGDELLAM